MATGMPFRLDTTNPILLGVSQTPILNRKISTTRRFRFLVRERPFVEALIIVPENSRDFGERKSVG